MAGLIIIIIPSNYIICFCLEINNIIPLRQCLKVSNSNCGHYRAKLSTALANRFVCSMYINFDSLKVGQPRHLFAYTSFFSNTNFTEATEGFSGI